MFTEPGTMGIEQMKKAFDVVYQPQVNIVCAQENEPKSPSAISEADSTAKQVGGGKRRKSHTGVLKGLKQAEGMALEMEDVETVSQAASEEYVYKSPSKMTSPEKKKFS